MVDLTRDSQGRVRARLLDLGPGRSGETYRGWLAERGEDFRSRVGIATLDPFQGYKNAIDDQLEDAVAVLDAFYDDLLVMPTWGRRGPLSRGFVTAGSA